MNEWRAASLDAAQAPSSPAKWRPSPGKRPHSSRASMPMRMGGAGAAHTAGQDGVFVRVANVRGGLLPAELPGALRASRGEMLSQRGVSRDAFDASGQGSGVLGIDEPSCAADHFGERAAVGRENG